MIAVVLAAGRSERFGADKRFARFRGRPLIEHPLATLAEAARAGVVSSVVAVLEPGDEGGAALVGAWGLATATTPTANGGLSDSLRAGLVAAEIAGAAAAIVALADQPLLRLDVVRTLVEVWRERSATAVRPRYADQPDVPGHPVLLDRSVWPLAATLPDDVGFAALFRGAEIPVTVVPVPGTNPDVDTHADLLNLEASYDEA